MPRGFAVRTATLAAFAAAALSCFVLDVARAEPVQSASSAFRMGPAEILPAITNPNPYRQSGYVPCDTVTDLSPHTCLFRFDAVPTGRLLEINNISCASPSSAGLLFKSANLNLGAGHALAAFEASYNATPGPFYLKAGERPVIALTPQNGGQGICAISGQLWHTN